MRTLSLLAVSVVSVLAHTILVQPALAQAPNATSAPSVTATEEQVWIMDAEQQAWVMVPRSFAESTGAQFYPYDPSKANSADAMRALEDLRSIDDGQIQSAVRSF
jgi:hypothetical protein